MTLRFSSTVVPAPSAVVGLGWPGIAEAPASGLGWPDDHGTTTASVPAPSDLAPTDPEEPS